MNANIVIRPHHAMGADDLALIAAWDEQIFADHPFSNSYTWATPDWHVLLFAHGQLASYLQLFERQVLLGSAPARLIRRWLGDDRARTTWTRLCDAGAECRTEVHVR